MALKSGEWDKGFKIPQGQTGTFSVDLKSLDEVFVQSPDFQKNMRGHLLYATNVKITTQETIDGSHKSSKKVKEYYLSRFVTAVSQMGLDGQQTPGWRSDTIAFEMTHLS